MGGEWVNERQPSSRRIRAIGEPIVPLNDRYPLAVTFICAPRYQQETRAQKIVPIGTGFVLNCPIGDSGLYVEYVVTASHVISGETQTYARFRTKTGGTTDFPAHEWFEHPSADVALSRLDSTAEMHLLNIPVGLLMGNVQFSWVPELGDRVYFIGLLDLEGYKDMAERNVPMVRSGTLGALYQDDVPIGPAGAVRHVQAHLIDCRSYSGFSGSPCFVQRDIDQGSGPGFRRGGPADNETVLLGLVSGHFDQWGHARLTGDLALEPGSVQVPLNSGVGVITPAEKIKEVLAMDDLEGERNRIERERQGRKEDGATLDKVGDEFERFEDLARKIVHVPKKELDEKRKESS